MGLKLEFNCDGCGYSATVAGGGDAGMRAVTTTIECRDCRLLLDVVISESPWDERSYMLPVCPQDPSHSVRKWTAPGPCPRCGHVMSQGDVFTLWD